MIEDDRHVGQAVGMFVDVLEMEMAPKARRDWLLLTNTLPRLCDVGPVPPKFLASEARRREPRPPTSVISISRFATPLRTAARDVLQYMPPLIAPAGVAPF